jgi:glyoxylase-like metal-dependent hydrolase (beta-lactamase superfamily II)
LTEAVREDREIGNSTVLFGKDAGKYPEGNSLLVRGSNASLIIDPSLGVVARKNALPEVDHVVLSHCHEDHLAGAFLFPDAEAHVHEADLPGWQSFEGFMGIYGFDDPAVAAGWEKALRDQFNYAEREDANGYVDGDVWELGGGVRVQVVHTPGHTRGHSALFVEPDEILYLGDIDLSSFGPYYGDAWSDLEDFERSLQRVRHIEAKHYATFHHIGVVDRATFLERLDRFEAVIASREERLMAYLGEAPRTIDEVAEHRFVYRPGDAIAFAEPVERRSMTLHIERAIRQGRVREVEPGRFSADVV